MASIRAIADRRAVVVKRLDRVVAIIAEAVGVEAPDRITGRSRTNIQPDLARVMELEAVAGLLETVAQHVAPGRWAGLVAEAAAAELARTGAVATVTYAGPGGYGQTESRELSRAERRALEVQAAYAEREVAVHTAQGAGTDPNAESAAPTVPVEAPRAIAPDALDGTIADVADALAGVTDPAQLDALEATERSKDDARMGVLQAIVRRRRQITAGS